MTTPREIARPFNCFVVRRSMKIAGDICVYTNHSLVIESIGA